LEENSPDSIDGIGSLEGTEKTEVSQEREEQNQDQIEDDEGIQTNISIKVPQLVI
jgi:hypothetical protein